MAKLNPKASQSRLESDEYLDQVSLEELTEFFFETEVLKAFGKQGKKVAFAATAGTSTRRRRSTSSPFTYEGYLFSGIFWQKFTSL